MKAIITTLLLILSISVALGQQYIINESFEGAWPPSGWISSGFSRGTTANTGTYSASSNRSGNYLITPLITVPSTISYYHRKQTGNCTFSIQTSSSITGPWTTMPGYPISAGNGWSSQTYDLSAYTNIYVRFYHVSNNQTWFLDNVQVTLASPTLQVSLLNFSSISGKQATINWTNGNGNGRVVFLREASSGTPGNAVNGTIYTASNVWSSKGTQLGSTGYYCIYNGNGSSVTVSQLNPNSSYYLAAYEYDSYNNSYTYVTGAAIGNFVTKLSTASDYFRTAKSGVWSDNSTWETSPDNNTWYAAELVPDINAFSVTIRNGHLVTLTSEASCNVMNFRGGTIKLGNYNLNIVTSFDGNPNFIYDGTGIPSRTGNLSSVLVTTVNPTSLPETLYSLSIDCGIGNYMGLTNNVVTNDIIFTSGGIALGSYNITVLGNVTGVPNLMFNGSGVATGMSSNSYTDITNPNPTNIPPIVYDLNLDLGVGNTALLPNDVEFTTLTITSGSLNLNNHKITFSTKGVALSSPDAVISALNISVNNTINYYGGQSIARTWTTSGTFINAITLYLTYPSSETSANSVKVWKRNHGETGQWDVIGTFTAVDNGTTRTVAVTGITSLNSSSKGDLDWTIAETDQTLPVELSSFTCMITAQNYIMLDWVTQTETNVSGFYIYRNQTNDLQNAIRINAFINATNTSHTANYAFVDNEATPGNTWYYWLQHIDMDGEFEFHGPVSIALANSGNTMPVIPLENNLSVYPNPFNPTANISFGLTKDAEIEVSIFNIKGERIKKLVHENKAAGTHRLLWDSRDEQGIPVASGIYFIRLTSGAKHITQKMVLQK